MQDFITPPMHVGFLAKKLFGPQAGRVTDGAVAYLQKEGGGPAVPHTHPHDHLFVVIQGRARIELADETIVVSANEAYRVPGAVPHSIWNDLDTETIMLGITLE